MATDVMERFMANIVKRRNKYNPWSLCWIWTGSFSTNGYGKFYVNGKTVGAHIFSYRQFKGQVPKGYEVDHFKCWTPACVNPAHLRAVTRSENMRNRSTRPGFKLGGNHNAAKTHCKYGHAFTPENTIVAVKSDGYVCRWCRECGRIRQRKYHAKQRGRP